MPDQDWMLEALAQAKLARELGEVPVGAVVVRGDEVVGRGHNRCITTSDPTAHAEVMALRDAASRLGNYRLDDCELFVTLEPCVMCSGAMFHARLKRVVFGAHDPKTGAAGSVIQLYANPAINHHAQVKGGVLEQECASLLQDFFAQRRKEAKVNATPLRDDALRTPDARFQDLPGYPWQGNYLHDLPSLSGLRMHYLDEGPVDANVTYLCLHGNPAWSYLYRKMIPVFLESGARVVAPDMIGFGKSDKPKKDSFHQFDWHRQCLLEFIERLNLERVVLVVQDWGGILGLTLPMAAPQRYAGLLVMNTTLATGESALSEGFLAWRDMCAKNPEFDVARLFARGNPHMSPAECAAYMAPFPDAGHRAALRRFPPMVPDSEQAAGATVSRSATEFWSRHWRGSSLMAIGVRDPVLGVPVMEHLRQQIRGCPEPILVEEGGHFVQEHGEQIARQAVAHFSAHFQRSTP